MKKPERHPEERGETSPNSFFATKRSLGQNFLNSDYVPKQMCDAAAITEHDTVLEIGPGTGALTRELLARGATVIAIEADARAIESLQDTFAEAIKNEQLMLEHSDARKLDPATLNVQPHAYKVVANIPYYLSGLLLRRCLDTDVQPSTLVFLIQKELAERIARSEKTSLLSLSVAVFGKPRYVSTVKRGHFTPSPKVDSAILAVEAISRENLETMSGEHFFSLLHLGFGQKRKQLQHNLRQIYDANTVTAALASLSLPETIRAEDISLENWLQLARVLPRQNS